jgi:uncharacterized metal-binding protein YceD (DUF177 family)
MRKREETRRPPVEAAPEPEFSRPFAIDKLGQTPAQVEIEAKPAEREALAKRFDLVALERLVGALSLSWAGEGLIRVEGRFQATGAQTCVVTLEPVPFELDEPVQLAFALPGALPQSGEVLVEPEGEDAPEPVEGGAVDLGEALAQSLAVALDPYPRAPGAELAQSEFGPGGAPEAGDAADEPQPKPFAALERLRRGERD